MAPRPPCYISVSRRSDIPGFFTDAFFNAWHHGEVTYTGWFGKRYTVSLRPEDVLGYIFWSKNFAPLIAHPWFPRLLAHHNALFHYTINDAPQLEPNVPALSRRLETLHTLVRMAGPQRVLWRYDPVCKYTDADGRVHITDAPFYRLLPYMQRLGLQRCYFSFMQIYAKTQRRGIAFVPFAEHEKLAIASRMATAARKAGIQLYNCCNPEIPAHLTDVSPAACVDNGLLQATDRFGVHRPLKRASTRTGCGCFESRDIGSYTRKCPHACRYCYANPDC